MKAASIPALDDQGKTRWRQHLDRLKGDRSQKELLEDPTVPGARSEISKFFSGDHGTVTRWLWGGRNRPKYTDHVASELGTSREALLSAYRRIAAGVDTKASSWHPAFPGVELEDAEIASPLGGVFDAANTEQVVEKLRGRRGSWCVWVIGPAGTGREVAARQLRDALREHSEQPESGIDLVLDEPHEGLIAWRRRFEGQAVVVGEPPVQAMFPDDEMVWPSLWGAKQVEALVARLVELPHGLEPGEEDRLREVAEAVLEDPSRLGPGRRPDLVIHKLRAYAREGPPKDGDEARTRALTVAWEAIQNDQAAQGLRLLGGDFPGKFWSDRWLRTTREPWTSMTRDEAIESVRRTAPPVRNPGEVRRLLERLQRSSSPGRRRRFVSELEPLIVETPEVLLEELVATGHLTEDRGQLRSAEPELALAWAARGLGKQPSAALLRHPSRLSDPAWPHLAEEMGHARAEPEDVLQLQQRLPPQAHVDCVRGIVAYLAALGRGGFTASMRDECVGPWAGALWSLLFDPFGTGQATALRDPTLQPVVDAVQALSRALRAHLPRLQGPDFVSELKQHVPESVVAAASAQPLMERPADGESGSAIDEHFWKIRLNDVELSWWLMNLAPYQCLPLAFEEWPGHSDSFEPPARPDGVVAWIEELASHDSSARRLLTGADVSVLLDGASLSKNRQYRQWRALPFHCRWRWLARDESWSEHTWWMWNLLMGELEQRQDTQSDAPFVLGEDDLDRACAALQRFDRDSVSDRMLAALEWNQRALFGWKEGDAFPAYFGSTRNIVRWAERLHLVEVLSAVAERARKWLSVVQIGWVGRRVTAQVRGPLAGHVLDVPRHFEADSVQQLWTHLQTLDELAADAKLALYQLGERELLRKTWQSGPGYELPAAARPALALFQSSSGLEFLRLEDVSASAVPLEACRRYLDALSSSPVTDPLLHTLFAEGNDPADPHTLWRFSLDCRKAAEQLLQLMTEVSRLDSPDSLDGDVAVGIAALIALTSFGEASPWQPVPLPEELVDWFLALPRRHVFPAWLAVPRIDPHPLRDRARASAARALLELGDEVLFRDIVDWRSGRREPELLELHEELWANMMSSPDWRDRLWHAPLPDPERLRLLNREASTDARPWFFASLEDLPPVERRRLLRGVVSHPDARPYLQRELRVSIERGEARDAAFWAIQLHVPGNDVPELEQIMRRWMLEDPDPLGGGDRFVAHEGWLQGGTRTLLNLAAAWPGLAQWTHRTEGLRRLWEHATRVDFRLEPVAASLAAFERCEIEESLDPDLRLGLQQLIIRAQAYDVRDEILDELHEGNEAPRPRWLGPLVRWRVETSSREELRRLLESELDVAWEAAQLLARRRDACARKWAVRNAGRWAPWSDRSDVAAEVALELLMEHWPDHALGIVQDTVRDNPHPERQAAVARYFRDRPPRDGRIAVVSRQLLRSAVAAASPLGSP